MAPLGRSPLLGALVVRATASETCAASGTCAEESTLLQLHKLKNVVRHQTQTWPQFDVDKSKCSLNVGLVYVDSQAECEAVAMASDGHEFYSYRHNADTSGDNEGQHKCFSSSHCDDGLIGDRTNDWNIYRSNAGSLWSQHEVDRSKCNNNVDVQLVSSQADCQQVAEQNEHHSTRTDTMRTRMVSTNVSPPLFVMMVTNS